jgi:hypothetical protein
MMVLVFTACGAVSMRSEEWNDRTAVLAREKVDEPPGDPACFEGELQGGARVVFRIERHVEGRAPDEWTLTLVAPSDVKTCPDASTLTLTDHSSGQKWRFVGGSYPGRIEIQEDDQDADVQAVSMPLEILSLGMGQMCVALDGLEAGEELSVERREHLLQGTAAEMALTAMVNNCPAAGKLAFRLVQLPSWWSWLVPTLNIDTLADPYHGVPIETTFGPGWRLPVEIRIKGDPAFYAQVTCVEPRGVLDMTGGIVEVVGFAPNRPDDTVHVTLIDAEFAEPGVPGAALTWPSPLADS